MTENANFSVRVRNMPILCLVLAVIAAVISADYHHHYAIAASTVGGAATGCYVATGIGTGMAATAFFLTGTIFGAPAGAVVGAGAAILLGVTAMACL